MIFLNLTPHKVTVKAKNGTKVFPAFGVSSRCVNDVEEVEVIDGVKIVRRGENQTTFLPPQQPGVMLIVSSVVRTANYDRDDLISPSEFTKDGNGNILECAFFVGNSKKEEAWPKGENNGISSLYRK